MYSSDLDPVDATDDPDHTTDGPTLTAVADPAVSPDAPKSSRGFLKELAQAMQATAERERARMSTEVDNAAEAHVEKVRTRAAAEAEELRRLAEDDITGIHAWTREETARIHEEAERRIGVRREELDSYLVRHTALIDDEVGQIGGAVADYHRDLDAFFDRLGAETDPAEFARLADVLPEPPDLAKVGGEARAAAVAELAREEDTPRSIEVGGDDTDHGPEADGGPHQLGAFDPGARGPELVPVMDGASADDVPAAEADPSAPEAEAPAAAAEHADAGDAPLPEGAVASVRMPIETVIPMAGPDAIPVSKAPAAKPAPTTPVAAATEAMLRYVRSLGQPRHASQHKD